MKTTQRANPTRALLHLLACTGAAIALSGCTAANNTRTTLGSGPAAVQLPAVSPQTATATWTDRASVTGLEREEWAVRTIVVPNDGVEHQPHLTSTSSGDASSTFPTIERALAPEPQGKHPAAQLLSWPIEIARDMLRALPRLAAGNLTGPDGSRYERVPGADSQATTEGSAQ